MRPSEQIRSFFDLENLFAATKSEGIEPKRNRFTQPRFGGPKTIGLSWFVAWSTGVRAMEILKRIEDLQKPDERNGCWARLDTGKAVTLQDRYAAFERIQLSPAVPDDVRSYFATIQNLCVYGWFAYDFYAVAVFLSYTLVEMALRIQLPIAGIDKRPLHNLLQEAVNRNLISEKAFSHIRRIRREQAHELRLMRQIQKIPKSSVPSTDYRKIIVETLPKLRNAFAHPRGHAIHLPGDALFALQFAADFVNQLFSAPSKYQANHSLTNSLDGRAGRYSSGWNTLTVLWMADAARSYQIRAYHGQPFEGWPGIFGRAA